jgi:hypothetical protein
VASFCEGDLNNSAAFSSVGKGIIKGILQASVMAIGMIPKYLVIIDRNTFLAASVSDVYWKNSRFNDSDQ